MFVTRYLAFLTIFSTSLIFVVLEDTKEQFTYDSSSKIGEPNMLLGYV